MAILFWLADGQTTLLIDPWFKGNPMVRSVPGGLQPALIFVYHGRHDHLGDAIDIAKDTGAVIISIPEVCHYRAKHKGETEAVWRPDHDGSRRCPQGSRIASFPESHSYAL